jgi:hypothetical protein
MPTLVHKNDVVLVKVDHRLLRLILASVVDPKLFITDPDPYPDPSVLNNQEKFYFYVACWVLDPMFGSATGGARPAPPRARIRKLVGVARIRNIFYFIILRSKLWLSAVNRKRIEFYSIICIFWHSFIC